MDERIRPDSDWELWPDRQVEDRRRPSLRSLFQPTAAEDDVEQLLAVHGRELDARTEELARTIADVTAREERTHQLRAAIETMLRQGAAELDERAGELNELAASLAHREAAVRAAEEELAGRRSELGAVELRRAAVERREQAHAEREQTAVEREQALLEREQALVAREQAAEHAGADAAARTAAAEEVERRATEVAADAERLERARSEVAAERAELAATRAALDTRDERARAKERALDQEARDLEERRRGIEEREHALRARVQASPPAPAEPEPATEHLVLATAGRYLLEPRPGPAPEPGTIVEVAGESQRVIRIGRSPLPDDARRCAWTEPVAAAARSGAR